MTAAPNEEDISLPEIVLAKTNSGTTEAPGCKAEGQRCGLQWIE